MNSSDTKRSHLGALIAALSLFTRLPFWRLRELTKADYEDALSWWPVAGPVAGAPPRAHSRVREDDRDGEDADIHTEESCDQVSAAVPWEVQAEHERGHGNQVNGDQNQGGHWCLLLSMHQFPHATL